MTAHIPQNCHTGGYPTLVVPNLSLEEPDLQRAKIERQDRTRQTLNCAQPREQEAATKIQACYRGYRSRKRYLELLIASFNEAEEARRRKVIKQMEEGELLIEKNSFTLQPSAHLLSHRLEVQFDDSSTTRRNKSRHYLTNVITIQRAWRRHIRRCRPDEDAAFPDPCLGPLTSLPAEPPCLSVMSQHDQPASPANLNHVTSAPAGSALSPAASPASPPGHTLSPASIEPDADSCVSDYSEMADPLREHLANIHIIHKDDLRHGNTVCEGQGEGHTVLQRDPEETEEEFQRRLKKVNYLSLAQEFAELKRQNARALPFDLHMAGRSTEHSPMSEGTSSEADSDVTEFPANPRQAWTAPPRDAEKTRADVVDSKVKVQLMGHKTGSHVSDNPAEDAESHNIASQSPSDAPHAAARGDTGPAREDSKPGAVTQAWGEGPAERETTHSPDKSDVTLQDSPFDVYTMDTALPQMDWAALEQQLARAAEEERRQKQSRRNDREEIRRKLAMGPPDEGDWGAPCGLTSHKAPLGARLQTNMNLQICFMNDVPTDEVQQTAGPDVEQEPQDLQERFQHEAQAAFAQIQPMAKMQVEIEKQQKRKSQLADKVGVPALRTAARLTRPMLADMNLAQLQVLVNDLHTQIENLNEELVMILVKRDDLHMEQDSMLVDIDDLSRRTQELSEIHGKPIKPSTPKKQPKVNS